MFKIEKGKNKTLIQISNEFYSKLNPVKKRTGSLMKNSLKKRLQKKIRSEKDPQKLFFYKKLADNKYKIIKEIITGNPTQLASRQQEFEALVTSNKIPAFSQIINGVISSTAFGLEVLNLFDYKSCRGSVKFVWLVKELDIVVCPYCNETYTHIVKVADDEKILYEFDHFIPKVIAPYLSLSFFNLIPSCHTCNSNLKGTTIFNLNDYTHPYADNFHSLVSFSTDKPVDVNNLNSFDVEVKTITTDTDGIRKSNNNISIFTIQQRYNDFKNDIIRFEKLRAYYSESKKQEMLNSGLLGQIFRNRDDLNKYIAMTIGVPINETEAMRKVKGKFELDLAREFKLID